MNLNEIVNRKPEPKRLICKLRLCRPKEDVFYGYGVYENEAKKNHPPERVGGLYKILQCFHCKRVQIICFAWMVLNAKIPL